MKHNYRKAPLVLLFMVAFLSSRCTKVADLQPTDNLVPDEIVQMIPDTFPGATDIVIKNVIKDTLWEATYTLDGSRFYVGMENDAIRYRDQLLGPSVPEEFNAIISGLAVGGGKFGDFRRDMKRSVNHTKYTLQGVAYRLEWTSHQDGQSKLLYSFNLTPHSKIRYSLYSSSSETGDINKIPVRIRQYFEDNDLTQRGATLYVDEMNQRRYDTEGNIYTSIYNMRFNNDLKLVSTTYRPDLIFGNREELPPKVIEGLEKLDFLKGAFFHSARKYNTEIGVIYTVNLIGGIDRDQGYRVELDSDGNLTYLKYDGTYRQ